VATRGIGKRVTISILRVLYRFPISEGRMASMRLWEGGFVSGGAVDNFTNDLYAKLSKVSPHANSPSPELANRNRSHDPFRQRRQC
jgi:hypothetical protein